MNKTHLKAAVIGGVIAFIWGLISWMVFPWHQCTYKKFVDESEVAEAIKDNASSSGVYVLPNTFGYNEGTSQRDMSRGMEMMQKGPFMCAVVHPSGMGKMTIKPFILSLVNQFVGALVVVWLLNRTKGLSYKRKVGFITMFGLGAGILCDLPMWTWWGYPTLFTFINMLDLVIAWFLAGLGIAKVLDNK